MGVGQDGDVHRHDARAVRLTLVAFPARRPGRVKDAPVTGKSIGPRTDSKHFDPARKPVSRADVPEPDDPRGALDPFKTPARLRGTLRA